MTTRSGGSREQGVEQDSERGVEQDTERGAEDFAGFYLDEERARHYHAKYDDDLEHRVSNRAERRAVDRLLAVAAAAGRWLDVPSGAGRFRSVLEGRGLEYVAADASPAMLVFARSGEASDRRAPAVRVDARRLPFADGAFDGILCIRFLHHFAAAPDRVEVLRELRRVTRRYAIVSFFDASSLQAARRVLRRRRGRATGRHAQAIRSFRDEASAAGFRVAAMRHRARFVSEWAVALLEG